MNRTSVYIIGSKGIPAKYGGFETFADRLVSGRKANIDYIVTGMSAVNEEYSYNGARCVQFKTGQSVASRMLHTVKALLYVVKDARVNTNPNIVLYILGCRAGIFLPIFRPLFKHLGVMILSNPDGAEWKRAKWNIMAKSVVWLYEALLVKFSDLIVCDAQAMIQIIHESFGTPKEKMTFIAYGSDIHSQPEKLPNEILKAYTSWLRLNSIEQNNYYLMVGRFVPENNYELVIREFMKSKSRNSLVIISNTEGSKYYAKLASSTGFENDSRIKFVGTVYDQNLLKVIRANAHAYIHGHEVGGTNPSLLEALGSTSVNIVYDVPFNEEVAGDAGIYFTDEAGNLANIIERNDFISTVDIVQYGKLAKLRIKREYNWPKIIKQYENLFGASSNV